MPETSKYDRNKNFQKWLKGVCHFLYGIVTLCFLLFTYSGVNAARPLFTDDAGTVDLGAFEMEFAYGFSCDNYDRQNHSLDVSFKHGLSERFDFGIAFPYEIKPMQGFGEAELGFKFFLFNERRNFPATSLTFGNVLGNLEYTLNGIMSKEFSFITVHLNFGYTASGIVGCDGIINYSSSIEFPVSKKITLLCEIVSEYDEGTNSLEGLAGLSFRFSEGLSLDFGIGKGFSNTILDYKTIAGLTYGF